MDTLTLYGDSFQSKVIKALMGDSKFLTSVSDIIDSNFFDKDTDKWIVGTIIDYHTKYGTPPSLDVFKLRCEQLEKTDKALKTAVVDQLKTIHVSITKDDQDFVKEEFSSFCKNQNLKDVILKSVDLLKLGNYNKIKELVDKALQAGSSEDMGHDYVDDFESRYAILSRKAVSTGWEVIDDITDGGLCGGELGVVVAPSGAGKTWALCVLGANALRKGKTVVHYTLELNNLYVGKRYDTILTGIPSKDLMTRKDEVERRVKSMYGKLVIKYAPPKSISAINIKSHLDKMISAGNKPDLVIIDYADLLKSHSSKSDSMYEEQGGVYIDLRAMAGELEIPIWTASQTNRDGIEADVIGANKIADSYAKVMNADFVMSLSRKSQDKLNNSGRVHVIKNRMGQDGMTFPCKVDTTLGVIELFDGKSTNGVMVTNSSGNGLILEKELLRKKYIENLG